MFWEFLHFSKQQAKINKESASTPVKTPSKIILVKEAQDLNPSPPPPPPPPPSLINPLDFVLILNETTLAMSTLLFQIYSFLKQTLLTFFHQTTILAIRHERIIKDEHIRDSMTANQCSVSFFKISQCNSVKNQSHFSRVALRVFPSCANSYLYTDIEISWYRGNL